MADTLKSRYGPEIPRRIGAMIRAVHPAFPESRFVREATRGLEALELMGRARPERYEESCAGKGRDT